MNSEWIDTFTQRLLDHGLVDLDTIQGCSEEEIASIEATFNIKLPEKYKEYLRKLGRKAGEFLGEALRTYPAIVELAREIAENLLNGDTSYRLPPAAFVFVEIYGCQFFFFDTAEGLDDPPVYRYDEGAGQPVKVADSITQALEMALQDELYDLEGSNRPYEYQFAT